ncbi:MAG TPA: ABC transporter ATP-binding protein [Acidimicrobiales bacterium]|nr:ABC transporter ATP-binding protein [Acidimicrobiales bacterium]
MLEVEALTVRYGQATAVDALDIRVGEGEIVALLGPNGAGKTSTLRALSRLVAHDGEVRFDGVQLAGMTPDNVSRLGLVHVPEGRHVFPTLTVEENLQMGLIALNGRSGYSIDDVYQLFPALVPLRRRLGYALSGGEQQMVAIGRGLVGAPRLLLLDEPSLGLSPLLANMVFDALDVIRSQTAILVVEQNTHLALKVCDRAVVISGGKCVLRGEAADLRDRTRLLASYLGEVGPGGVLADAVEHASADGRPSAAGAGDAAR